MDQRTTVLAFDFGASSGRAVRAEYSGGSFTWEEIHRFDNIPYQKGGHLRWDFETLMAHVREGIAKAGSFDSVGIDTWGVDFGLLDPDGCLLEDPVHYRDSRTQGVAARALRQMDGETLYAETGTQILSYNTLFQLLALKQQQPDLLAQAQTLLFMPDLFTYRLCGCAVCERSIASTSQMLSLPQGVWNQRILSAFGIPANLLLPTVPSGTIAGRLAGNGAKVISVAGHDTQCAVAALPADGEDAAFLSCGTWSLLGCELDRPRLSAQSLRLEFSNELGANGKIQYLKNIIGLWLIQESRRAWRAQGQEYSYADLECLALEAPPLRSLVDPDDPSFMPPGDIPARVQAYCAKTGQPVPHSAGEITRCIYESLALKYRYALEQLEQATGKRFHTLHILGGGVKDGLLCRMTADCIGRPVIAGPAEATALGNILIQLTALGALPSLEAGRQIVKKTQKLAEYRPQLSAVWDAAYPFYRKLLESGK
ncbi:MAG TPA: rhamnulokinase [Firmicutes bacterium]|nr:rhamnulokinase [Bacillota bacterium]